MKSKDHYLCLLHLALKDLKSRTDGSPVDPFAVKVADTLHNVPGTLALDWTESRELWIRGQIDSKGEVHHIASQLAAWEREASATLNEQEASSILPDSILATNGRSHRAFFLKLLGLALVEIRFLQHEPKSPGFAAQAADLMHLVTEALLRHRHWNDRVGESLYGKLMEKAKGYELEGFVGGLVSSIRGHS